MVMDLYRRGYPREYHRDIGLDGSTLVGNRDAKKRE